MAGSGRLYLTWRFPNPARTGLKKHYLLVLLNGLGEHCAHASRRRQILQKRRHALHPQLDCPYRVEYTEAIPDPEMQSTGSQDSIPTTR